MKLYYSVVLAAWTSGWVTFGITRIGETSGPTTYTFNLPVTLFIVTLLPAWLGYMIGRTPHD